jgi:hypothetical protein
MSPFTIILTFALKPFSEFAQQSCLAIARFYVEVRDFAFEYTFRNFFVAQAVVQRGAGYTR